MSIQVKRRREAASFLAGFTGAQAELIVDTTNNRVQVHDGVTAGGWPAAKLAETQTIGRTAVVDANYAILPTDVLVAVTALTASRTLTLPASSAYPPGRVLRILDESGAASASLSIVTAAQGADTIDGAASIAVVAANGSLELVSNGAGKWFALRDVIATLSELTTLAINTGADPNNPFSATLNAALFNALDTSYGGSGDVRVTVNKLSPGNTASFLFQDGFSGRAEIGLTGDDNFHFKVSKDGSTWNTGLAIDATTGALTPGNARTPVDDAAYAALATDRAVAYTALSAARIVTLPAAARFPAGTPLLILDESGACSATRTITATAAGADLVDGAPSLVLAAPFGFVALTSDGVGKWTILARWTGSFAGLNALAIGAAAPLAPLHVNAATDQPTGALAVASDSALLTAESNATFHLAVASNAASDRFSVLAHRARGSFAGLQTVQANDLLFSFIGGGYDGGAFQNASMIEFICDGAPAAGSVPTAILFSTGGASANRLERLRVSSAGNVGVNNSNPSAQLDVGGLVRPGTYTVATLPAGVVGAQIFVANGRKQGEAAGVGTGVLAVFSNGAWRRLSDDSAVAA